MSHPDVVKVNDFREVRRDMSIRFASCPDFLYCVTQHLHLSVWWRSYDDELIEFSIKSIATILDGVFELVDSRNIYPDFRWEARKFIRLGLDPKIERFLQEESIKPTLQAALQKLRDHRKGFPDPNPVNYCRRRLEDAALQTARRKRRSEEQLIMDQKIEKESEKRERENKPTYQLQEYLGQQAKDKENIVTKESAKLEGNSKLKVEKRYRKNKEEREGWDDGEPIVYRTNWQGDVEEIVAKGSTHPMGNDEVFKHAEEREGINSSGGRPVGDFPGKNNDAKKTAAQLPAR
ncbi:hypothetical protein AA313_de0204175 [Arthrobotrys entomopaga]|nr:hypothetical protein AA313_de0204175 [Arthrobotrys entomopaga]